jgi:hypothetical protein
MDQPDVQMAEYLLERQNNSHEPQAGADGNDIRILLQQHLDQIDIKIRVAVQEELQKRIIVPESGNLEEPAVSLNLYSIICPNNIGLEARFNGGFGESRHRTS